MQEPTGRELAAARTILDVTQVQLARAAGRRREWVSRIESKPSVPASQATRYIEALASCATTQHEEVA